MTTTIEDKTMTLKTLKKRRWLMRLTASLVGAIVALVVSSDANVIRLGHTLYDKIGITVVALAPLFVWGTWTAINGNGNTELTLSYIGVTAQRVGLLGTVIGIVAATIRIGDGLNAGAAGAVSGALPAVGQALISTAVGFVIALGCDFVRYLQNRDANQEIDNVETSKNAI